FARRALAQATVDPALGDAEQRRLVAAPPRGDRPPRPGQRAVERGRGIGFGRGPGRALVEHHRDVDADPLLRLDYRLGREADLGAVEVAAKGDAAVVDAAQARE